MSSLITSKKSVRQFYNSTGDQIPVLHAVSLVGVDSNNEIPLGKITDNDTDRIIGISIENVENDRRSEAVTQGIILGNFTESLSGVEVTDRIYWDIDNLELTRIPNQFPIGYIASLSPLSIYVDIVGSEISPGDDLRINDLYADEIFANSIRTSGISNAGKVIVLNDIEAPTGNTYDQGGLILRADSGDKTILYDQATNLWNISEGINVPSGSGFLVNNVEYITTKSTDDLVEGSNNRYYTEQYFDDSLDGKTTDDLSEGSINQYFTDTRAKSAVISQQIRPNIIDLSPSEDAIYKYIKDSVASEEIIFHGEINNTDSGTLNDVEVSSFSFIRFNNAVEISGFEAPTGIDENKVIFITNENTEDLILLNENTGSSSNNRIVTGSNANITLRVKATIGLIYDRLISKWKVIGGTGGGSGLNFDNRVLITNDDLKNLVETENLNPNVTYQISDSFYPFPILLKALDKKTLNSISWVEFPCFDFYNTRGNWKDVFRDTSSYVVGDVVTWGYYQWKNITGNTGTYSNVYNLNSDWERLEYDDSSYVLNYFEGYYSFEWSMLETAWDAFGNIYRDTMIWEVTPAIAFSPRFFNNHFTRYQSIFIVNLNSNSLIASNLFGNSVSTFVYLQILSLGLNVIAITDNRFVGCNIEFLNQPIEIKGNEIINSILSSYYLADTIEVVKSRIVDSNFQQGDTSSHPKIDSSILIRSNTLNHKFTTLRIIESYLNNTDIMGENVTGDLQIQYSNLTGWIRLNYTGNSSILISVCNIVGSTQNSILATSNFTELSRINFNRTFNITKPGTYRDIDLTNITSKEQKTLNLNTIYNSTDKRLNVSDLSYDEDILLTGNTGTYEIDRISNAFTVLQNTNLDYHRKVIRFRPDHASGSKTLIFNLEQFDSWSNTSTNKEKIYSEKAKTITLESDPNNFNFIELILEYYPGNIYKWQYKESGGGGGQGSSFEISQTNTFTKGQPIYYNEGDEEWQLAQSDDIDTIAKAVVLEGGSPNFTATLSGEIEFESSEINDIIGTTDFIPGKTYYVSDSNPGTYTLLSPAISNPMLLAISETRALVKTGFNAISTGVGESILDQTFTVTTPEDTFTLDYEPLGKSYTWVYINGFREHDFDIIGKDVVLPSTVEDVTVFIQYVKQFKLDTRNNRYLFNFVAEPNQTTFTLPVRPESLAYIDLWVDGAYQTTSFTLQGLNLVFNSPLAGGEVVVGKIIKDINFSQGIDNFIRRLPRSIANDTDFLISDLFEENLSGRYEIMLSEDPTISASVTLKAGTGSKISILTNSPDVDGNFGNPNTLNIDLDSDTIRIQNRLGQSEQIIVTRFL